jgi:hypothetical protein
MQSTDLDEIKAALWEQACHPCTRVSWGLAQVMAVRKSRGRLQALLRGHKRWYEISAVTIERALRCPTGSCDLEDESALVSTEESPPPDRVY